VKIDQTYVTPAETHNPHRVAGNYRNVGRPVADDLRRVASRPQSPQRSRTDVRLPKENVRVITKSGSGFGSKLWPWTHCALACAAARELGKPVKLVLSRRMMFQSVGHRPRTQQRVRLGATNEGKLVSLMQDYLNDLDILGGYHENCGEATSYFYSVPNVRVHWGRTRRNIGSPTPMRGPGAVPGLFATESAMNELADQLKIDPVRLRELNEPKIDEGKGIPFSSRHYLECLQLGGERFGWANRNAEVGSMKRDGLILGWGVSGAAWISGRFPAQASVELRDDGSARVACGTQDIGTGTYTILAQLVSDKTGVPLNKIEVVLGDTSLPPGPVSGGSLVTGSVIPAVFEAAENAITHCDRGYNSPGRSKPHATISLN
jgi:xanthine dehydrogenase YagR molybdenum-binding subunit